jgi:cell division septation protein DedD
MLEAQDKAGKMESVVVSDVTANSAIQQRYGLQKGDVILQIGPLSVRDNMSSADEAKDFLLDAYQKNQDLVVLRGWDKLTLPMPEGAAPAVAAAPAPADSASSAPATPGDSTTTPAPGAQADASQTPSKAKTPKPAAPRKEPPKSAMERQLDLIRNIPGQ